MPDPTFQVAKNDEVILIASRGAILTLPHAEALQMAEQVVALLRGYRRTPPTAWSGEEKAEFRRLYVDEGLPIRKVAARLGITVPNAKNLRLRWGIPAHSPNPAAARNAAKARAALRKLRAV